MSGLKTVWDGGIGLSFSESVWKMKTFHHRTEVRTPKYLLFLLWDVYWVWVQEASPLWDEKNYTRFWNVAERSIKSSECRRKYHLEASFSSLKEIYRQHADLIRWNVFTLLNHSPFFRQIDWMFLPNWCLPSIKLSMEMIMCLFHLYRVHLVLNGVTISETLSRYTTVLMYPMLKRINTKIII